MEIIVYPTQFGIQHATVQTPQGDLDVVRVNAQDAGGTMIALIFTLPAWEAFRRLAEDPEGESARAEARSKIVLAPNGMANRLRPKQ
jgi:hypothetical protein